METNTENTNELNLELKIAALKIQLKQLQFSFGKKSLAFPFFSKIGG